MSYNPSNMRVVLERTRGAWAGIRQILGTVNQVKEGIGLADMPTFIEAINFGDYFNSASFITVNKSYVLYRETP